MREEEKIMKERYVRESQERFRVKKMRKGKRRRVEKMREEEDRK